MFALRSSVSSHIYRQCTFRLGHSQRRWAQVEDVRFLVTHQQTERIAEKYREKLQQKAREEGLQSVEELRTVYNARIQEQQSRAATSPSNKQPTVPFPPAPSTPASIAFTAQPLTSPTNPPATPGPKTLSSYLDLGKTLALPPREIEHVWRLRHASSPTSLCATLPSATYTRILQTARRHPQFILPLPRRGSAGAEIHFLQFSFPFPYTVTVVFTHLAEYKLRGEFSQPHTAITMHSELMQGKGLVLMQGQVVEGRGVNVEEARWLVLCMQKFYGLEEGSDVSRRRLLEMFSKGDRAFRVEDLLEEAEKIV